MRLLWRRLGWAALALALLAACASPTSAPTATPMVLATQAVTATPTATITATPEPYPAPPEGLTPTLEAAAYPAPATPGVEATPGVGATPGVEATPTATATPTLPPATPQPLPTDAAYRSNIGPYLLANPEAGQPTHNLLKDGAMRGFMAINPSHWTPFDALPHMEGYGRNWLSEKDELAYIARREEGARDYFERFVKGYRHPPVPIHAWMSTWAFRFGDRAFAEDWVAFQREWLRLMHENGFKGGIGGMKAHRFQPGEITWLTAAIAEADYLFLAESGAPRLMSPASVGVTTLVYRDRLAELRQVLDPVPPLILDVCVDGQALADVGGDSGGRRGYRDFGISPEDYLADLRAYDVATLYDPYVKHVFWFATNITQETASFDVNTPMLAVAEGWHRGE